MENIVVLIFDFMFDGIAEHEGRKTELANAIFLRNYLFFLFNLFLFNDFINKC